MGLRFIYGRAGSGKSEYCFNEVKQSIDKLNKIYMITQTIKSEKGCQKACQMK